MNIFKSNKGGENIKFEGQPCIEKYKGNIYITWKCFAKMTSYLLSKNTKNQYFEKKSCRQIIIIKQANVK